MLDKQTILRSISWYGMVYSEAPHMVVLDEHLRKIVQNLTEQLEHTGLNRERGGMARSVAWAERSGRARDSSWLELRLHNRAGVTDKVKHLQAGLLEYQPLAHGGSVVVFGEYTRAYVCDESHSDLDTAVNNVTTHVREWLTNLA